MISLTVCFVPTDLTVSGDGETEPPVVTALLISGITGVPAVIPELPFAFSFATDDLLCVALRA
jgi:hypothetical protein